MMRRPCMAFPYSVSSSPTLRYVRPLVTHSASLSGGSDMGTFIRHSVSLSGDESGPTIDPLRCL